MVQILITIAMALTYTGATNTYGYAQVVEGNLYRESSAPEVYIIQGDKKIWVPTPDALFAMGHDWSRVNVVAPGALDTYKRFNIPSSSPTPGSIVYPPNNTSHFPLKGIPTAAIVISQGREVNLVELRGWLRGVDNECGDGTDFHYFLELDTEWALSQGMDLNMILRVGNVGSIESLRLSGSPRKSVSIPFVKIELNSWGWRGHTPPITKAPSDWTHIGNCGRTWPFDHYQPKSDGPRLKPLAWDMVERGPYVRIVGSIVTDSPHDVQHRPNVFFSRHFAITTDDIAEWQGAVPDWHPGVATNDPRHYARWTEIHPPDLIEVLDWKVPLITTRSVALAARVGVLPFGWSNSCEAVEFDIFPEASRPASSQIAFQELRGPETYFPWGENQDNGSWITAFDDHVRVKARVCGGAIGGSPGRFKAIYRVWWEQKPADELRRSGSFLTSDNDEIRYEVTPGSVGPEIVEFQLCLNQGLTWEKKMNMPDGEGSSWDLMVKDQRRCDTNGLWAHQVRGQVFTFSKYKGIFGGMRHVHSFPISGLGTITPGSRVTFTWMRD